MRLTLNALLSKVLARDTVMDAGDGLQDYPGFNFSKRATEKPRNVPPRDEFMDHSKLPSSMRKFAWGADRVAFGEERQ